MKRVPFSIGEAIKFAFNQTINHFGLWIGVWLTQILVSVSLLVSGVMLILGLGFTQIFINKNFREVTKEVSEMASVYITSWPLVLFFVLYGVFGCFIITWLYLGVTRIALDFHDHGTSSYQRLFTVETAVVIRYVVATWLWFAMMMIGFLVFIIPGVFIALLFCLVPVILVDRQMSVMKAFELSYRLTSLALGRVFLFGLLYFFLSTLMGLVPLVGIFATPIIYPFYILSCVYVYRRLEKYYERQET